MIHSRVGLVCNAVALGGLAAAGAPVLFSLADTPRGAGLVWLDPVLVLSLGGLVLVVAVAIFRVLDWLDCRHGNQAGRKSPVRNVPTALTFVHDAKGSRNA